MNTKEETVAIGAIGALILRGHKSREHLLMTAIEGTIDEEHGLRKPHHVFEKGRMGCEAL